MKYYLALIFLLFALSGTTAQVQQDETTATAKESKQKSKKQKKADKDTGQKEHNFVLEKTPGKKVYIFGVGYHFGDSTIYVTAIEEVDSIALQKKTKFLPYRSEFTLQFRQYLETTTNQSHMTCCVFFSDKRNTLLKRFNKVKGRYLNSPGAILEMIGDDKFKFKHPLDVM